MSLALAMSQEVPLHMLLSEAASSLDAHVAQRYYSQQYYNNGLKKEDYSLHSHLYYGEIFLHSKAEARMRWGALFFPGARIYVRVPKYTIAEPSLSLARVENKKAVKSTHSR